MASKPRAKKPTPAPQSQPQSQPTPEPTPIAQNTEVKRMPLKVNFQNVGAALPPSIYIAQLEEAKAVKTKDGTKDMMRFKFVVKDDEQYEGRAIFRNFMVDGNALFYLMEALVSLGADPEDLAGNEDDPEVDIEEISKQCVGAKVRLHLTIREYEDPTTHVMKESNEIAKMEPM